MKLSPSQTLHQIAALIGCKYVGAPDFQITGINEIHKVESGDLMFVDHPKYYDKALQSAATAILINKEVECPNGKVLIISDDPCRDYNFLTRHFSPWKMTEGNRGKDVPDWCGLRHTRQCCDGGKYLYRRPLYHSSRCCFIR